MEVNVYIYIYICIEFWTLKMKRTQYGICRLVAFKNARAMILSKSGGAGKCFWLGLENVNFFIGGLILPVSTSPKSS